MSINRPDIFDTELSNYKNYILCTDAAASELDRSCISTRDNGNCDGPAPEKAPRTSSEPRGPEYTILNFGLLQLRRTVAVIRCREKNKHHSIWTSLGKRLLDTDEPRGDHNTTTRLGW